MERSQAITLLKVHALACKELAEYSLTLSAVPPKEFDEKYDALNRAVWRAHNRLLKHLTG